MISHALAHGVASLGRGKDSMLMHVTPKEVAGLKAVAKAMGGEVTTNPHTGLPEAGFFDFIGSLLPTIVGIALAPETGGTSLAAIGGGAATGAAVAALKGDNPLMGLLTGGMGGWGGSGLGTSFNGMAGAGAVGSGAENIAANTLGTGAETLGTGAETLASGAQNAIPGFTGTTGEVGSLVNTTGGLPPLQEGANLANSASGASNLGQINSVAGEAGGGGFAPKGMFDRVSTNISNLGSGIKQMITDPTGAGWDSFTAHGGSMTKLALPVGFAALNSIDPADPYPENPLSKYDPKRRLNLSGGTGLTLDPNQAATGGLASINGIKHYAIGGAIGGAIPQGLTYTSPDGTPAQNTQSQGFGIGRLDQLANAQSMSNAQQNTEYARGGYLDGPGDGMSDSIHASIEGKQPAKLADGEFVVPADVVSHIGNGSSKAGAKRLYGMMDKVRHARTGSTKQGKQINPNRFMPA